MTLNVLCVYAGLFWKLKVKGHSVFSPLTLINLILTLGVIIIWKGKTSNIYFSN